MPFLEKTEINRYFKEQLKHIFVLIERDWIPPKLQK